ncbi:TRAP transporter substrate-binding protein [Mesorhizobium sp. 1B3]|uniref:TRAP transporter substrate-binding protein n=1 Tax=Mesorhizobium sp. 1B3 TaxID=3243599 RepID=UPI003D97F287
MIRNIVRSASLMAIAFAGLSYASLAHAITLRAADVQANTAYETGLKSFAAKVEEATQGRVTVQVTMGTALGSEADIVKQVRQGTLDIAQVGLSGYDKFQLFYIPFLFDKDKMMDFTKSEIADQWKKDVLKDWNVHLLEYIYFGPRHITANKPILKPEDLQGVKIRVPQFPTMVDAFQKWGANVIAMPVGELYISLQTGTIDAQENPLNFVVGTSLFEVQKALSLTAHVQAPRFLFISDQAMQRLTPEDQAALRKAAAEVAADTQKELLTSEEKYRQTLKDKGMTVHEVDPASFIPLVSDVGKDAAEKLWGPGVLDKIRQEYGPKK